MGDQPLRETQRFGFAAELQYDTTQIDGYFRVVSKGSGKCLSVPSSTTNLGAQMIIWGCSGNNPAQRWRSR